MHSVDLFTGIGGFARALDGICTPIVYCDSSASVRVALRDIVRRGLLPDAPIVNDARDLVALQCAIAGRPIDLLTAGFPCVGFSKRGRREGLANQHSGMFSAALAAVAAFKPRLVLYENVSEIRSASGGADLLTIVTSMRNLQYSVRWTVVAASDVGAPHVRARWFCLCALDGVAHPDLPPSDMCGSEDVRNASRWTICPPPTGPWQNISGQLFLLGNSLVPQAARLALYRLYTGFAGGCAFRDVCVKKARVPKRPIVARPHANPLSNALPSALPSALPNALPNALPKHACVDSDGSVSECVADRTVRPARRIVVSPKHFPTTHTYVENASRPVRSPLLERPLVIPSWPTPRTGGITHSHNLSERTRRDLATVAMFASSVDGVPLPTTDDTQRMSL